MSSSNLVQYVHRPMLPPAVPMTVPTNAHVFTFATRFTHYVFVKTCCGVCVFTDGNVRWMRDVHPS